MKNNIKSVNNICPNLQGFRQAFGLTMLLLILSFQLHAQTDTLKILNPVLPENIGAVVSDGQIYSTDLTGKQIQLFNALNEVDAASRTSTGSFVRYNSSFSGSLYPGIVSLNSTTGIAEVDNNRPKYIVLASADGAEFSFNSVFVCDVVGTEPSLKIEGFRNGTTTGSVTLNRNTATEWQKTFDPSFFPVDIFGNVDEVRFSREASDGFTGNLVMFNNFVIKGSVDIGTGISTDDVNKLQVYPNPVVDKLYVSGVQENSSVRISDINGRVIISKKLKDNNVSVNFLQEGVYTIMITDTKGTRSAKFVKKGK